MSKEKALGIAVGNINPITGEMLADFNSRETKVTGAGAEVCVKEHKKNPNVFTKRHGQDHSFPEIFSAL